MMWSVVVCVRRSLRVQGVEQCSVEPLTATLDEHSMRLNMARCRPATAGPRTVALLHPPHPEAWTTVSISSDVVLGLGPWLSLRTKSESLILALALSLESLVLSLALRLQSLLTLHILRPLSHWCRWLSAYDAACSLKHFSNAFTYLVH